MLMHIRTPVLTGSVGLSPTENPLAKDGFHSSSDRGRLVATLAPINNKKSTSGLAGKSGIGTNTKKESGFSGKLGLPKSESSSLPKSSASEKSLTTPSSFSSAKSGKSSTSFGIIWIPTKKRIKKDYVYNPHHNYKDKERSPSMHHFMDSLDKDISKEKNDFELRDESSKGNYSMISGAGTAAGAVLNAQPDNDNQQKSGSPLEKQSHLPFITMTNIDLIKTDHEDMNSDKTLLEKILETKEEADEDHDKNDERDYLENAEEKSHECEKCHNKSEDHADGPFLDQKNCIKPPPPSTTDKEEKDWLVDCIYYSVICCDCTIM